MSSHNRLHCSSPAAAWPPFPRTSQESKAPWSAQVRCRALVPARPARIAGSRAAWRPQEPDARHCRTNPSSPCRPDPRRRPPRGEDPRRAAALCALPSSEPTGRAVQTKLQAWPRSRKPETPTRPRAWPSRTPHHDRAGPAAARRGARPAATDSHGPIMRWTPPADSRRTNEPDGYQPPRRPELCSASDDRGSCTP
jgi:hypothetical protein